MNTLLLQSYEVDGTDVVRAQPDSNGCIVPWTASPYVVVIFLENVHATLDRIATINARGRCENGRLHSVSVVVPAVTALPPIPISIGVDSKRFGDGTVITFDVASDIRIGAAIMKPLVGYGSDDESPPDMPGTPGTIPLFNKDTEPIMEVALASGMRLANNDGRTQLWIQNTGTAARTVYPKAHVKCSMGEYDDEVIVVQPGTLYITKEFPTLRFGRKLDVVYDSEVGLYFAAVRQEAYAG